MSHPFLGCAVTVTNASVRCPWLTHPVFKALFIYICLSLSARFHSLPCIQSSSLLVCSLADLEIAFWNQKSTVCVQNIVVWFGFVSNVFCLAKPFWSSHITLVKDTILYIYLFIYVFFSNQLSAKPIPWPISLVNSHSVTCQEKFKVKEMTKLMDGSKWRQTYCCHYRIATNTILRFWLGVCFFYSIFVCV